MLEQNGFFSASTRWYLHNNMVSIWLLRELSNRYHPDNHINYINYKWASLLWNLYRLGHLFRRLCYTIKELEQIPCPCSALGLSWLGFMLAGTFTFYYRIYEDTNLPLTSLEWKSSWSPERESCFLHSSSPNSSTTSRFSSNTVLSESAETRGWNEPSVFDVSCQILLK